VRVAKPKQQRIDPRAVERTRDSGYGAASKQPSKGKAPAAPSKGRGRSGRPGGRPEVEVHPAKFGDWVSAARIPTLALGIAPVALGTAAASLVADNWWDHWFRAVLCLVVALSLQIGVNYANDYSDGIRGTDKNRVGPVRLVGSGRARPRAVLTVALIFFGIAAVAGLAIVWLTQQWWLLAVGAVCIAAAWFYTGGKRPYGYMAFGELAVFIFFGIVPVAGTMYVQVGTVNVEAWLSGVAAGAFAAAVLLVNNLRDRAADAAAGKRTLSVLIGTMASRVLYVVLVLVPFGLLAFFVIFYPLSGFVFFALLAAVPAILIVTMSKTPREYRPALPLTLLTALGYGLGLAAAIAF
jgi:1,4-dihydroxy-2-naphthoate octaprenyltransferase